MSYWGEYRWLADGRRWVAGQRIHGCIDGDELGPCITVPLPEKDADRVDLVAAILGDRYEISERLADWERELLDKQTHIDPADVKVGDVVSVEADDGTWLVRGEVTDIDPDHDPVRPFGITLHFHQGVIWPELFAATVRLVRRAEPEPDPEQVEALAVQLEATWASGGQSFAAQARQLVRRGVTVRKET